MSKRVHVRLLAFLLFPQLCFTQYAKDSLLTATSTMSYQGEWFGILPSSEQSLSILDPPLLLDTRSRRGSEIHAYASRTSIETSREPLPFEQRFVPYRSEDDRGKNLPDIPLDTAELAWLEKGISRDAPDRLEVRALVLLKVPGMSCRSCARSIERKVRELEGIQTIDIDVKAGVVRVQCDSPARRVASLLRAIRQAGYAVKGLDTTDTMNSSRANWH
jgi:copper chaperone CopZ